VSALARAVTATRERPALWIVALCGFLARGGIVLLVLPMIPLPSTVGMATFVGPTSVTAAGLTPDSVARIGLLAAVTIGWFVAGNVIGALTDRAIVAAVVPVGRAAHRTAEPARSRLLLRIVAVRLVALLPFITVVAVTARSVGELVYQELILPSDINSPIVLRVVQGARLQVGAIVLAWVVGEVLGGIAVRLAILEGRSFGRSIGGALAFVVRHPLATVVGSVAGLAALVVAVAPALLAIGVAWTSLGVAVAGPLDGSAVAGATIVVVVAWAAAGLLVAIASAWRGALWTSLVAGVRPTD
jgi:hypothetical protein